VVKELVEQNSKIDIVVDDDDGVLYAQALR
jgi:hypothetical protein